MYKYFYLKQFIIVCMGLLSCYLMLSLITFYPFDNTFFQSSGSIVFNNIFGRLGALSSDVLFFTFGCVAYFFPCIVFFIFWTCLSKHRVLNFFDLSFKIIGSIMILCFLCGLTDFFLDDFYCCFSGGIIGYLLRTEFLYAYSDITINIICLFFLFFGTICLFGFFWLVKFMDVVGKFLCFLIFCNMFFISKVRKNDHFRLLFSNLQEYFFKNIKLKIFIKFKLINQHFIMLENIYFKYIEDTKKQFYYFLNKARNYINIHMKYQWKLNYKKIFMLHKITLKNQISEDIALIEKNTTYQSKMNNSILCINQKKELLSNKNIFNVFPSLNLLSGPEFEKSAVNMEDMIKKSKLLELALSDYRILAKVVNILPGPVVTRFELDLAPGVRSSRISNLSSDLARSLSISHIRVIEVIPGKSYVGLEIPNQKREMVYLREVLGSDKFQESCDYLTLGLGKDIFGNPVIANLGDMPHLLISGATGSGKSISINNIIVSILYKATPKNVRFIMIDPKILELSVYEGIPHLLKQVVTDMKDAIGILNWCVKEMERRCKIIASCGVRHLENYNKQVKLNIINNKYSTDSVLVHNKVKSDFFIFKELPYIVIIIDEFSDLIVSAGKQVELLIVQLSQKARACGMHLILATQRPSVNVITGLIKANIPSRIAFTVFSKIDSYTILDQSGAESLLGKGDMLYLPSYSSIPIRVHGAFISDKEVSLVVKYWKDNII